MYADLRSPPLSHHDLVVTRHSDDRHEINCGFVYFNLRPEPRPPAAQPPARGCAPPPPAPPPSPPPLGGAEGGGSAARLRTAEAEAVALAQLEMTSAKAAEGGAVPMTAAEWVAAVLWERMLELLEAELPWKGGQRPPADVLWEQVKPVGCM